MKELIKLARQNKKYGSKFDISVVIPNYNYSKYLYERVKSVLKQKVRIHEIIILDDNSTDDSVKIIKEIDDKLSPYIDVRTYYNTENSGSVFKQWSLGFKYAKGDYVWIAEADDSCDDNLLLTLSKKLTDDVVISYTDSLIIDENNKVIAPSVKDEIDIRNIGHWDNDFKNDGLDEILNYAFLNLTLFNVSSALIRNGDYESIFEICEHFKQAGDWMFYINVMKYGNVLYSNEVHNYYRWHGSNISFKVNHEKRLREVKYIYRFINNEYNLSLEKKRLIEKRYKYLLDNYFKY